MLSEISDDLEGGIAKVCFEDSALSALSWKGIEAGKQRISLCDSAGCEFVVALFWTTASFSLP